MAKDKPKKETKKPKKEIKNKQVSDYKLSVKKQ